MATRLHGAKVFSLLDVRSGFWQVKLDEPSSYLTTFNTPFGRYRWKRLPFGICSAPEIFQRKMHQLIEGLSGVEIVADDFVIVGFGDNEVDAHRSHDANLLAFIQRCEQSSVKFTACQEGIECDCCHCWQHRTCCPNLCRAEYRQECRVGYMDRKC